MAAGRITDWAFVDAMLQYDIVDEDTLKVQIALLPIASSHIDLLKEWVDNVRRNYKKLE